MSWAAGGSALSGIVMNASGFSIGSGPISLSLWYKPHAGASTKDMYFYTYSSGTPTDYAAFVKRASVSDFLCAEAADATHNRSYHGTTICTADAWNHIAVVFPAGFGSTFTIYLNGSSLSLINDTSTTPTPGTQNTVELYNQDGASYVAEMGVFQATALSAGDVTNLYSNKWAPSKIQGCTEYWSLLQGDTATGAGTNGKGGQIGGKNMVSAQGSSDVEHPSGMVYGFFSGGSVSDTFFGAGARGLADGLSRGMS